MAEIKVWLNNLDKNISNDYNNLQLLFVVLFMKEAMSLGLPE